MAMLIGRLVLGVVGAVVKGGGHSAPTSGATQALLQNRMAVQQHAIQMSQLQSRLQEQARLESESHSLEEELPEELPEFPHAEQEMVSNKFATFVNQNQPQWQQEFAQLQQAKSKVFQQSHFEFDEGGNPVMDDDTGLPQLFPGEETPEQTQLRQTWESGQQSQIHQDAQQQKSNYTQTFTQTYQQAVLDNVGTLADPQVQAKLHAVISQGEAQMQDFEQNAQTNILKVGLPTPALQEQAGTLTKKIRDQENDFWDQIGQTPEGQTLQAYQENAGQVILQQKSALAASSDTPVGASPAILSMLSPTSDNPDLADAVQNALIGASQQFKTMFNLK